MKILFIAPRLPLPADTGGKIRTWNILKQVSRFARVHLVCFSFDSKDETFIPQLKELGIETTLVPAPRTNLFQKIYGVLFNPLPYSIAKYNTDAMRQEIGRLLSQQTFDLVHVDHLHMTHYCELLNGHQATRTPSHLSEGPQASMPHVHLDGKSGDRVSGCSGVPVLLDEHNVEYKILERCAQAEKNWFKRIGYWQQAGKTKSFESKFIKKLNVVTAVSEDDAALLRELSGDKTTVEVLANGVDTEYFASQSHLATRHQATRPHSHLDANQGGTVSRCPGDKVAATREDGIIFTGSLDWFPNDDAAQYFIKEILPLIWEKNPNVKFYIVGKGPSSTLCHLCDVTRVPGSQGPGVPNRIIVTGRVEDVRPYLVKAKVFVVPLRIGGGTRLKILEAMSFGIPVVSTSIGAEGIAYTRDKDIIIADQPEEFAKAVLTLMENDSQRDSLANAGRKLVEQRYDWKIIGNKLKRIYEEMVKQ